ncbi:MAG: hypothetical protein QOJ45_2279 [Verrucomicrobiota bacterium]
MNRFLRGGLRAAEILIFTALILGTRCANYQDVFVGGDIYFTDADCYSRMTRVRMCAEHPGLILRHHSFENFPAGTTPHTTAPFDYLIVALAAALKPFTARSLDLAGAIVSPFLALLGGWFLWWWSRQSRLRYRAGLLLLYAASPILAHGGELGRPDHQSLLLLLLTVAICAEWTLQTNPSREWSLVSGGAWGLALWVSVYEPLVLLAVVLISHALFARQNFTARVRALGWIVCGTIVALALLIEQRLPGWSGFVSDPIMANWARTIGELNHVPLTDVIWLSWAGLLLIPLPALLWIAVRRTRAVPFFLAALLAATFLLTVWQARWAYFFVIIFALIIPGLLAVTPTRIVAYVALGVSLWPILKSWDEKFWPNESENVLRLERRFEAVKWRETAKLLVARTETPFLAPWWWSPAVAYWSGQPGLAGSSHEALSGIAESARFYLAPDAATAREISITNKIVWVLVYDADRTAQNSSAILGISPPAEPLCRVLDRTPAEAPRFLQLVSQNAACKLFRVRFSGEKEDFPR